MGIALKLQKLYIFRSVAMLLVYITQNTALSADGFSLKKSVTIQELKSL